MPIISTNFGFTGQEGIHPRRVQMITTDSLSMITQAGYITQESILPSFVYQTDIFDIVYDYVPATSTGSYGEFTCAISGNIITLIPYSPADIIGSVTANHFSQFANSLGALNDTGKVPTNNSLTNVVMFTPPSPSTQVTGFTPGYVDNNGTVGVISGNQYFKGSVIAGIPDFGGVGGDLISFPSVTSNGFLRLHATSSPGDNDCTITNAPLGQDTTYTIVDPAQANANLGVFFSSVPTGNILVGGAVPGLINDSGYRLVRSVSPIFTGGPTFTFSAYGITASTVVVGTIFSATNIVPFSIQAGTDQITVNFASDPGTNTSIQWMAFI